MLCLYISIFLSPFLSLSLSLTLCLSLSLSLCLSLPLNHSLTLSCLSFSRSHLSLTLYYLSLCLSLCLSLVYISVSVILALRLSLPPTFDLFTDFSLFLNAYVHLCKSACTFSYSFVSMLIRLSYNLVRCSSIINMTKGSLVIIDNCSSSAYALFWSRFFWRVSVSFNAEREWCSDCEVPVKRSASTAVAVSEGRERRCDTGYSRSGKKMERTWKRDVTEENEKLNWKETLWDQRVGLREFEN